MPFSSSQTSRFAQPRTPSLEVSLDSAPSTNPPWPVAHLHIGGFCLAVRSCVVMAPVGGAWVGAASELRAIRSACSRMAGDLRCSLVLRHFAALARARRQSARGYARGPFVGCSSVVMAGARLLAVQFFMLPDHRRRMASHAFRYRHERRLRPRSRSAWHSRQSVPRLLWLHSRRSAFSAPPWFRTAACFHFHRGRALGFDGLLRRRRWMCASFSTTPARHCLVAEIRMHDHLPVPY